MSIKLAKLLEGISIHKTCGSMDIEIKEIAIDSRKVRPGHLFVAVKGYHIDGHDFIEDALARGAVAVVTQKEMNLAQEVSQVIVADTRKVLSQISNVFYDFPGEKLKIAGVTGTNGKSTVAYVIQHILNVSGRKAGRLGTLGYDIGQRHIPGGQTTPGPPQLQEYLAEMVKTGAEYAAMEVSSHALDQDRVKDINFAAAVFTNISLDHLDYHLSMSCYIETKYKFFEKIISNQTTSVINADSSHCPHLSRISTGKVITYGIENKADLRAESIVFTPGKTEFDLVRAGSDTKEHIETSLLGRFNVSNLLAAISVCFDFGLNIEDIKRAVVQIGPIPGRLEKIECGQPFTVLVDFAHTPDAIELVLTELKQIIQGRVIIVFGCGGDRDKSKRPIMGKIAVQLADKVIITSDNPRSEDPADIIGQIVAGIPKGGGYEVVADRYEAIKKAIGMAEPKDLIIIAGKGHESCQILKNTVVPFDDRQVVRELLGSRS